jgi:site-specific recombinase XerD
MTSLSVAEAIEEFLEAVDRGIALDRFGRAFSPEDVRQLHWWLDGHVREDLGDLSLAGLRRDDVEALVVELGDAGVSQRRLRAITNSVRALYDYAVEQGLAQHNPAERVALPDDGADLLAAEFPARSGRRPPMSDIADRAISLGLRVATLVFALIAIVLLAESLGGA